MLCHSVLNETIPFISENYTELQTNVEQSNASSYKS